ncbi:hypothetical protein SAMN04488090_1412 [Siphonobacter aquaeclarae]|uniref:Uncharacterized protein n=1 Tax=Siphonobacter aquaeclarae TaxID=563176 RepID=A0A1G9LHW1_9BACT|nr:hypothetical protein SAMN04488090_1412 [Siphonobacter aquaeclarae]
MYYFRSFIPLSFLNNYQYIFHYHLICYHTSIYEKVIPVVYRSVNASGAYTGFQSADAPCSNPNGLLSGFEQTASLRILTISQL